MAWAGLTEARASPPAAGGAVIVRGIVDEFDAEVAAAREVDEQYGLSHRGMPDGAHRPAAQRGL
jgi:hypothetical protein